MSMTKEAIQLLQDTAASKIKIESNEPVMLLPQAMSLESLEIFQASRSRFRGTMKTTLTADFANYIAKQKQAQIFINIERMTAKAFFNLGDNDNPGHGDHCAQLTPDQTPDFNEIVLQHGQRMPQKRLAEWLEEWRDNLSAIGPDDEEIPIKKAIAAIRKITIEAGREQDHSVGTLSEKHTSIERIEASSRQGVLPVGFIFKCSPFANFDERDFHLWISLLTGDKTPVFVLRILMLCKHNVEIGLEFEGLIKNALTDKSVDIYIGDFHL